MFVFKNKDGRRRLFGNTVGIQRTWKTLVRGSTTEQPTKVLLRIFFLSGWIFDRCHVATCRMSHAFVTKHKKFADRDKNQVRFSWYQKNGSLASHFARVKSPDCGELTPLEVSSSRLKLQSAYFVCNWENTVSCQPRYGEKSTPWRSKRWRTPPLTCQSPYVSSGKVAALSARPFRGAWYENWNMGECLVKGTSSPLHPRPRYWEYTLWQTTYLKRFWLCLSWSWKERKQRKSSLTWTAIWHVLLPRSDRRTVGGWAEAGNDQSPAHPNHLVGLPRPGTKNKGYTCVEKRCMQSPFAFEICRGDSIKGVGRIDELFRVHSRPQSNNPHLRTQPLE